jgi:hypothetical protein
MSRMQEFFSRKDYHCARPAVPVAEPCEADTQEQSDKSPRDDTLGESDYRQLRRSSILWIVRKSPSRDERSSTERTSRLKSPKVARTSTPGTGKRSESRRVSALRHGSVSGQPRQRESESVAAQIRRFQERADLRECLLPGMLARISRKACEGWQRQASARNSRMMARIKLEPCKSCQYCLIRDPASV